MDEAAIELLTASAKDKDAAGTGKESPGGRTKTKASIPATSG